MRLSGRSAWLLRIGVGVTLTFIYVPLIVIAIYAFNSGTTLAWPPDGLTLDWFDRALDNQAARDALANSVKAGLAVARYRFFGRETISFLVILPIALPGIVTGIALNSTFTQVLGIDLSLFTIVVGHATFCIVVVYNNVLARLRRVSISFEEASADLGARPLQTFRHVTLPNMRTALVAGGLLAFALSFDEIIVTTFTVGTGEQTIPIWIFQNLFRPNQVPVVNVVALMLILLSMIPVYLAHRLTREEGPSTRAAPVAEAADPGGGGPGRGAVTAEATAAP
jgi:putative spermidine/putrescine transport system permease protein